MSDFAEWTLDALVEGVAGGDARALARAITLVENADPLGASVVRSLYPRTGGALVVGLTGGPGTGKSTLGAALVRHLRSEGLGVGFVSVDPSSALTHGALLGDRIRLAEHFLDPGVFIRSMGTRGHTGGLAEATLQVLILLDAAGKDVVLVETVGAGQSEIDVVRVADVVVLALMPGAGDAIQALKAGIMEIPDVIAVTKADLAGADSTLADVRAMTALEPDAARRPDVLATSAATGEGIAVLWDAVARRHAALRETGELDERRRRAVAAEVVALATGRVRRRLETTIGQDAGMQTIIRAVERRELDPLSAAIRLLEQSADEETGAGTDAR